MKRAYSSVHFLANLTGDMFLEDSNHAPYSFGTRNSVCYSFRHTELSLLYTELSLLSLWYTELSLPFLRYTELSLLLLMSRGRHMLIVLYPLLTLTRFVLGTSRRQPARRGRAAQ
jgi:hypothetical protein